MTAADVARYAGVSRSAVSRTFTPGASVSREARARVVRAAEHLGYRVNRLAQSLISSQSSVIGLVGTELQQPFHAALLAGLSGALIAEGFQCMLLNAANTKREIGALIARVLEYRVSAIVVMTGTPPARIVEECLKNGVRVILVNKLLPALPVDMVMADHGFGGRVAAETLLGAGCRRLAVVSSAARTASLLGRLESFRARVEAAGLPLRVWQEGRATDYGTGRQAALALLGRGRIDGVFCVSDLLALGFMDAARHDRRRRIPEDVSVIGFDDIPQAAWDSYRLTTFRQPVGELAQAVTRVIKGRAERTRAPHRLATIPVELVVRNSVRGLAAATTA